MKSMCCAIGILCVCCGGCASSDNRDGRVVNVSAAQEMSPSEFLVKAAASNQKEIELSTVARERAQERRVQAFAQMLLNEHENAGRDLRRVASDEGVPLPREFPAPDREIVRLHELDGEEFDRAYLQLMLRDHEKSVAMYQYQASQGTDPEVKKLASRTLPKLEQHLREARRLAQQMNIPVEGAATRTER